MSDSIFRGRMGIAVLASVIAHPIFAWGLSRAVPTGWSMHDFCASLPAQSQPPVCKRTRIVDLDRIVPPPPPKVEPPKIDPPKVEPVKPLVAPQPVAPPKPDTTPPEPQRDRPINTQPPAAVHTAAAAPPVLAAPDSAPTEFNDEFTNGTNPNGTGLVNSNGTGDGQGTQTGPSRAGNDHGSTDSNPPPAPQVTAPPEPTIVSQANLECDENVLRDHYPDEAKDQGIAEMVVRVRVTIDASGAVTRVVALSDPGYGFAEAARRSVRVCQVTPARDSTGKDVAQTIVRAIRFELQ